MTDDGAAWLARILGTRTGRHRPVAVRSSAALRPQAAGDALAGIQSPRAGAAELITQFRGELLEEGDRRALFAPLPGQLSHQETGVLVSHRARLGASHDDYGVL